MPLPPSSFTKSKWLAFFAEMTAKVNHHNPVVVMEGCDMVRRLLTTRISVGAFLEEGAFLMHLLAVLEGIVQVERLPTSLDVEMLDSLFRTLFLIIDMMSSLGFDGDSYYLLLVSARSYRIAQTLAKVLESSTRVHFGRCSYYLHVLLTLPLATALHNNWALDVTSNVTLRTHVRSLEDDVRGFPKVLQSITQTSQSIAHATNDSAVRCAAQVVANMSHQQYRRFARHIREHGGEGDNDGATTTGYAFDGGAANADDSNSDLMVPNVTPRDVDDVFATFSACKNHHDFFQSMNRLWCVSVARSDVVAANVHLTNFQPVLRFLSAAPKSGIDRVLFTSIISWMSVLGSVASLPRELLDCVAGMVPTHFIPMMAAPAAASPNSHVTPQQISLGSVATPSASSSWQQQQQQLRGGSTSSSSIGGLVNSHLLSFPPQHQGGGGGINMSHSNSLEQQQHHITPPSSAPPPVALASSTRGAPDVSVQLVSFMIFLEHTCTADLMITWLRGGLLSFLDGIIRTASGVKSILVDSPSTVDGALSDEAYLNCALESSRSELVTLAASACKLLSAVMNNFADLLLCEFPREISSAVELFVPQLFKIVLHNPTLSAAEENTPGSILHHVHRCHRALRSTSIGECAAVSLDACLALLAPGELEINKLRDMMLLVPALTRATKNSVVPHIRACVYRVLIRLCGVPSHLVLMVREMPSILSTAVKCILEVNSAAPQWESAAAAEWLVRVIAVAALDSSTEGSFDLSQTALTVRLLHLVSSLPIGCTSAAMLALCTAMYEQQERLRGATNSSRGSAQESSSVPATLVFEPYGRKSMQHWSHILLTSANANRSLVKVCEAIEPTRCNTRDVFSRALAVYEDVAAQFCHAASAAHGVRYLVEAEPSRRAGLGDVMLYEFVSAALNAPSPAALSEMVRVRFGEACPFATSVLVKAHEYMIEAVAAVLCSWVSASSSRADHSNHLLEPLPSHLLTAMIELMRDTTVSSSTRLHLTKIVNSTHSAPHQTAIRKSFSHLSGEMFEASLSLRGDAPALLAMRCRLLAEHSGASNAAMSTGWLHDDVVVPLEKLSAVVAAAHHNPATKQAITSVKETDVVNSLLSSMSSFFSNPGCAAIPAEYTERLSLSWLRLLRAEGTPTQQTALRCIPFLAQSPAGRLTALHEAVKSGDVHARSCLGFAMHWALPFTLPPSVLRASGPTRRPPRRLQKASEVHLHSQVMDGIAAMISLETDPCARCLMKVRSYEVVEDTIVVADVQHGAPSVLDYKILAAASFCADVQVAIARSSELMTAVLATAEDRPTQDVGVFALLILRNLCFSANLKIQMCQDSRVLFALRNALLCQSSAAAPINPRHLGDPAASPTIALEVCSEVMLRQELAARALWSLTHNNERGKAYVRGALQQQSSSSPLSALPQQQYLASSSSNKHHTATTALRIPSHYSVGPQASDHLEMMDEVIKMLTSQEVIKPAATIAAGN